MMAKQKVKSMNALSDFSIGSTGGLLRAAEVEERYVINWKSKKEAIFESPTGGATLMKKGDNLVYYAKKEQCLAVGTQLQTYFKISDYSIYRIFANGRLTYQQRSYIYFLKLVLWVFVVKIGYFITPNTFLGFFLLLAYCRRSISMLRML